MMRQEYPPKPYTEKSLCNKTIFSRPAAQQSSRPASGPAGFTLLELLITTTLLGILVLIVSAALRIGARAWEKGSENAAVTQPARVVLELMRHQLSSALPYEIEQEGETHVLFAGDEKQLQFVSIASLLQQQNAGNVVVTYRVNDVEKEKVLEFKEENTAVFNRSSDEPLEDIENWRPLSENIEKFSIEYAGELNPNGEIIWETSWDSRERKALPVAVKLSMEVETGSLPIDLVVRMPANNVTAVITS